VFSTPGADWFLNPLEKKMQAIINVPFHGEAIITIDTPDGVFVPVLPLCERFGMSRQGQQAKLNANPQRWGSKNILLPSTGGTQEMFCLPMRKIAGWLTTINVAKVKPEIREALTLYQNEADEVLDRHFRVRARETADALDQAFERSERFRLLMLASNPTWNKIARWQEAGVYLQNLPAMLRRSEKDTEALVQEMEDTGAIDRANWLDEQFRKAMFPGAAPTPRPGMTPVQPGLGLDEIAEQA
jgi:hypothetical protein